MNEYTLKYSRSAETWEESLPIGNGKLGATIFGRADTEILRLNEETLWEGFEYDWDNPETKEHLPRIRTLIFEGEYQAAQELALKYLKCKGEGSRQSRPGEPYGTFRNAGDIVLVCHKDNVLTSRTLNLKNGYASTVTTAYTATHYASLIENVLVTKIEATNGPVTIDVRYDHHGGGEGEDQHAATRGCQQGAVYRPDPNNKDTSLPFEGVCVSDGNIHYAQQLLGDGALRWCCGIRIDTDGEKLPLEDGVRINNAQKIVLCTAISTSYANADPDQLVKDMLALPLDEAEMFLAHTKAFESHMTAATLSLESDEELMQLDTDQRLQRFADGHEDIGFYELYFNYGKYLLLSSSAKGCTLPANLQGIWTKDNTPPWSSDYHTNINLQMNYWPAEVTGLGDCTESLFRYIELLREHGTKTAEIVYGCRGWVAHHATTPFGFTAPGYHPSWGSFALGGAWCCMHIFDHYRYTLDQAFLKSHWSTIKECALFFFDDLVEDPSTGYLVTCPSNSPENSFIDPKTGEKVFMYAGPTMDSEILRDLFSGILELAEAAGETDASFLNSVEQHMLRLTPIRVGKNGTIMEWLEDYEEFEPGHRHISHLYALYPSKQITSMKTPDLYRAARATIERRLSFGGGHTGWSRAWIINFYARLHDGEEAKRQLDALFTKSTLPNLFDNHPPFQIDGNFGGCAGIAEMLLQDTDKIELLPALPKAWKNGSFTGFRVKGNKKVSCAWQDGKIISSTIE